MKKFKVLFAAMFVAALGIVAFSSFKGSEAKPSFSGTYYYTGGTFSDLDNSWTEDDPQIPTCGQEGTFCSFTFTGTASAQDVLNAILAVYNPLTQPQSAAPTSVIVGGVSVPVTILERTN